MTWIAMSVTTFAYVVATVALFIALVERLTK
jgi:hypothetical protein